MRQPAQPCIRNAKRPVFPRSVRRACALALALAGIAASLHAGAGETDAMSDPYLWLEDVGGEKALGWVRAQNAKTEAELAATPAFKQLEASLLAIYDSSERIPQVVKLGDFYYDLWRDSENPRGLWRRTTLDEYRKPQPRWEAVLDLDALNRAEGENWVFHDADCLRPDYTRCLIALSRGGADADVTREFDLTTKTWVEGGFFRPEAKGALSWIDRDTVYVSTDFGEGSLTAAGYPRIVKRWKRGTPMASAEVVFEARAEDMGVSASHDDTPGFERDFISRSLDFFNNELYLLDAAGKAHKIDAPDTAAKSLRREWLLLRLRDPWTVGGTTYPGGALLAAKLDDFLAGARRFEVLFEPTETTSLAVVTHTRNHLVLEVRDDVKTRLSIFTPTANGWVRSAFPGVPEIASVNVRAVSADSDAVWLTVNNYLTPTTLKLAEIGKPADTFETLKQLPAFFDASKHVVEQHFATSKDGTRVPYFLVRPKDIAFDGSSPTLLYGYGGFGISQSPAYNAGIGKGWLNGPDGSGGGAYAVANIRGGGEYGPHWHQAAQKANRHKAYEDFAAVAQDLIARKITSPRRLGISGVSNGGLLMGNMLTQYPELFGAVVIQVPLLDMRRYSKLLAGASWMSEYGDPDKPEEWAFIKTFSPYHLFDPAKDYPPTLLLSSTRDDRVHPGHARKMAAKMEDAGKDVRYYENTEGGHGGAADSRQQAHMDALYLSFLWRELTK
ncbi:MAG: prolyl oligopeptidase family serine peptidase [Thermomonas sp.]|uniref:prolyl oligopeptidase family serine peptidase n=1 Tax=Thermomonas sp. TaxID=1971895 RepID=UPI0039E611A3